MPQEPFQPPHNSASCPGGPPGRLDSDALELVDGILSMYRRGWFPMADPDTGEIDWFQPTTRGVIPLEPTQFRVPRSLRQKVRQGKFEIRTDTAFRSVITACGMPRPSEPRSWIDGTIIETYCLLHRAGHAHSVEAWLRSENGKERLVGGLYGVHIGSVFFGESMFSRPDEGGTDASKVCLVHLVHHLRRREFTMLDAQLWNEHLAQFGCLEEPQESFLERLRGAVDGDRTWNPFEARETIEELHRPDRA